MGLDNPGKQLLTLVELVNSELTELCEKRPHGIPSRLWDAMSYSLLAGGKRVRPVLCLLAGKNCGSSIQDLAPMAIACEMVHTASLIHDDLPSMDNDNLRRGKPSNHVVFGEALALLAGDALFIWAFDFAKRKLEEKGVFSPKSILDALGELLEASGPYGICGGQVLDSDPQSFSPDNDHPWNVAAAKTAILLRSSVVSGAILGGASEKKRKAFSDFGYHLGTAFQIVDDILDVKGDGSSIGKTPGKDASQGKMTFVAAFGIEKAKMLAATETQRAIEALLRIEGDTADLKIFPEILRKRCC